MNATELDDVMALLERLVADPSGFAERLFQQAVGQWAAAAGSGNPGSARGTADWIDPSTVFTPRNHDTGSYESLADSNALLASALGACECWGSRADCAVCKGEGSAGWMQPDVELFHEFVGPAVQKMTAATAEGEDGNRIQADKNGSRDRAAHGGNA